MRIEKAHPEKLCFSIVQDKLFFAISSNVPYFGIKLFKKIDASFLLEVKEDFKILYKIIDELKLSEDMHKLQDDSKAKKMNETPEEPKKAAQRIAQLMEIQTDKKGRKTLRHTDESQWEADIYKDSVNKLEKLSFMENLEHEKTINWVKSANKRQLPLKS